MESSALAIMNFTPAKPTSYSVPDGNGGSVEVNVGDHIEVEGELYEVLEPESIGKMYVRRVEKH